MSCYFHLEVKKRFGIVIMVLGSLYQANSISLGQTVFQVSLSVSLGSIWAQDEFQRLADLHAVVWFTQAPQSHPLGLSCSC